MGFASTIGCSANNIRASAILSVNIIDSSQITKNRYDVKIGIEEIVDLDSDNESERIIPKVVKLEFDGAKEQNGTNKGGLASRDSEENRSSNVQSTSSSVLEQGMSPVDDTGLSSASPNSAAPFSRQFWKAGYYDNELGSTVAVQNARNYLHVHPMFLHSNATSHKWAFGAIAKLLDNAIDEAHNGKGATFVIADKILNPKGGSPALLIQDDGGGMDPDTTHHYGNGFKASSLRLGGDVIVFSRHLNNR
ncbi:hypothetical protein L6164_011049 [Bauhinia variegata]|uniref:Uncharacterized protein n=1 Tax=Bauhinia variegata TaxID=167791 RepID=A0ACB9P5Y4_BAUVA|nr:hypothetical protein L6164_011049 [Bauhinia variegata]